MRSLDDDIKYLDTILNEENEDQFGFLYSMTTENLAKLFEKIDVKDQDIYTVLSSSDLLFSLLAYQAKHVDSFDINPISNRYFHLRKWLLQYKLLNPDSISIKGLSNIVNGYMEFGIKEEQESAILWRYYLDHIDSIYFYDSVLFEHVDNFEVSYQDKIGKILESLNQRNPQFDCIDICSKLNNKKDRKYDKVFLSNILDYNRKPKRLEIVYNNMLQLLKAGGSVICSNIENYRDIDIEKEIFSRGFSYNEILTDDYHRTRDIIYYQYIKK